MNKILQFCLLLAFLYSNHITAQISSGSMTMKITDFEMTSAKSKEVSDQMAGFFNDMSLQTQFRPGEYVTSMSLMGMEMNMFYKDKMMEQYMDLMGQKMLIKINLDEINRWGFDIEQLKEIYQVSYDKTDTKEFFGLTCYRTDITIDITKMARGNDIPEEMQQMSMVAYITDEVHLDQYHFREFQGLELNGFPFYMKMNTSIMNLTYEVTEFTKSINEEAFKRPIGDYKEISAEDWKKMGFGDFGF